MTGVWFGNDNSSPTKKATGGGLPVEIWTKFMKAAHQGVPVAALPGLSEGGWITPPAPVQAQAPRGSDETGAGAAAERHNQRNSSGLDFWLLDKLFGRR